MGEVYLSDNAGHRVPPADAPDPVAASGQTLTNGTKDTNTTVTVVEGASYALTAQEVGGFYLGILTTATAANIIWACPVGKTIIISIPSGVTTLHYATDTNSAIGYLRKLTD
ncbi:hypothetical protein LCGC14_2653170 [marine sediment metagenome]|uniref:Uncharacterized protein n=1 Tax=marine sediment metagenome TaxID=412755 RepID=A0A0F8ZUB3_9ZZZZ